MAHTQSTASLAGISIGLIECDVCGYYSLYGLDIKQHLTRCKRGAKGIRKSFSEVFFKQSPSHATDPHAMVVAKRRGPKPRDYEGFLAAKVAFEDLEPRVRHVHGILGDLTTAIDACPASAPMVVYRLLWGSGAPDHFRCVVHNGAKYVVHTVDDPARVVTKKRQFCHDAMQLVHRVGQDGRLPESLRVLFASEEPTVSMSVALLKGEIHVGAVPHSEVPHVSE